MKKLLCLLLCMPFVILSFAESDASTVGFADVVVDSYFDYTAVAPIDSPYGGWYEEGQDATLGNVSVDVVLGNDPTDGEYNFLSVWTGSYVTVGFTDETVIDRPGDDIIIRESGPGYESAEIYVSSNGADFTLLGTAISEPISGVPSEDQPRFIESYFDLADIEFSSAVVAIKVVGLDFNGTAPGFDLLNVEVLNTPIPGAVWLLGSGLFGLAVLRRKRIR